MRNLFQLIYKYYVSLITLLLLILSFSLLVSHNRYHRAVALGSSNELIGNIYEQRSEISEYLKLRNINDSLARANTLMRNERSENFIQVNDEMIIINDTLMQRMYRYLPAKVINNSVHRQKNYITIDRGARHGIEKDMGVVQGNNLVGIVKEVSENFSVVIPILNNSFKASVRLKGSREIGLLRWDGKNPRYAIIEDIPKHTLVELGDSVITTGFSNYFPEGIITGTVSDHGVIEGDNFHNITIRLSCSFAGLDYVEVVENMRKEEMENLLGKVEQDDS